MSPVVNRALAQLVGENPPASGNFMSSPWFPAVIVIAVFAVVMATTKRAQRLRKLYLYAALAGTVLVINFLAEIPPPATVVVLVVAGVAVKFFLKRNREVKGLYGGENSKLEVHERTT